MNLKQIIYTALAAGSLYTLSCCDKKNQTPTQSFSNKNKQKIEERSVETWKPYKIKSPGISLEDVLKNNFGFSKIHSPDVSNNRLYFWTDNDEHNPIVYSIPVDQVKGEKGTLVYDCIQSANLPGNLGLIAGIKDGIIAEGSDGIYRCTSKGKEKIISRGEDYPKLQSLDASDSGDVIVWTGSGGGIVFYWVKNEEVSGLRVGEDYINGSDVCVSSCGRFIGYLAKPKYGNSFFGVVDRGDNSVYKPISDEYGIPLNIETRDSCIAVDVLKGSGIYKPQEFVRVSKCGDKPWAATELDNDMQLFYVSEKYVLF